MATTPIESESKKPTADPIAKAERQVRYGWIIGAFTVVVGIVLNSYLLLTGDPRGSVFGYLQLALWAALTYGVFRRSRAAAVAMLALFIAEKLFEYFFTSHWGSAVLTAIKFYFIAYAAVGTFTLHKLRIQGSENSEA